PLALAALLAGAPAPSFAAEPILVFAAASLKNALDNVATAYRSESGNAVSISYAGSSALAKQIEEGAPADIFISADLDWMDYLQERNLIKEDTRETLLGNRIVLIAPADATADLTIGPDMDLAGA